MITNQETNSHRKIARIVGMLFLAGMIIGMAGHILMMVILAAPDPLANVAANSMLLAVAAILMLLPCAWDAAHGVVMFPVLKKHSEGLAVGYLAFRIIDAVFLAISVVFVLLQITLSSEYVKAGASDTSNLQALSTLSVEGNLYAYNIAMSFLGVAGLILCYTFYRTKLVPRFVAGWGLVGYAVILTGCVLEILGFGLTSMHVIPGGLWEVFIGVWLITKGFSSSAKLSQPASTGNSAELRVPNFDPAKA